MNTKNVKQNDKWQVFSLKMTKSGFDTFSNHILSLNQKKPQIYIHVSTDELLEGEVLGIGQAKNGIIDRWVKHNAGHGSTFLWSIGECKKYKGHAPRYPDYLIFFANMYNLNTKLYVLNCDSEEEFKHTKKELMNHFNPIWEKFKKEIKNYFQDNEELKKSASEYGHAIDIINQKIKDMPNIKNMKSANKIRV